MTRPGHLPDDLAALAARARSGEPVTPYELWRIADRDSGGSRDARRAIYRHAMIHAGFLARDGGVTPLAACPVCRLELA